MRSYAYAQSCLELAQLNPLRPKNKNVRVPFSILVGLFGRNPRGTCSAHLFGHLFKWLAKNDSINMDRARMLVLFSDVSIARLVVGHHAVLRR